MFICENPSLDGVRKAVAPLGGPRDFDTQWTGDPAFRRDKRFRTVLCDLGLKDGGVWERGGWNCYITNVIKQAVVVTDWQQTPWSKRLQTARSWSDILQMEFDVVRPHTVFCVGNRAHEMVERLQGDAELDVPGRVRGPIRHYSYPRGDEWVEREMREGIEPYL